MTFTLIILLLVLFGLLAVALGESAKHGDEIEEMRARELRAHDRRAQIHVVHPPEPIDFEWVDPQVIERYRNLRPAASGVHVTRRASAAQTASPTTTTGGSQWTQQSR